MEKLTIYKVSFERDSVLCYVKTEKEAESIKTMINRATNKKAYMMPVTFDIFTSEQDFVDYITKKEE